MRLLYIILLHTSHCMYIVVFVYHWQCSKKVRCMCGRYGMGWGGVGSCGGSWAVARWERERRPKTRNRVMGEQSAATHACPWFNHACTSCTPIKSHVTTIILLLLYNQWAKMHTCINILSSWRPQGNMHIHVHLHVHTDWYDIIWFAIAAWRLPTQSLRLRGLGTGGACPWHGMCIHYTSVAVLCRAVNLI